ADAALEGGLLEERLLERMEVVTLGDALDRRDCGAFGFDAEHAAGVHEAAVDDDRAGSTVAVVAAFLGAGQSELVVEDFEHALAGFTEEVRLLVVDGGLN